MARAPDGRARWAATVAAVVAGVAVGAQARPRCEDGAVEPAAADAVDGAPGGARPAPAAAAAIAGTPLARLVLETHFFTASI